MLNCSRRKTHDDDEQVVPRLAILGEQHIDANYNFACSPSDVVELYDDKVEPARAITVIPLTTAAGSATDYELYDPYNHEKLTRHVESARVVPTPSDIVEIMKEQAQLHPVLPDPEINVKGTIPDESYPQKSDLPHRGVVSRGVRRRAPTPAIENVAIDDSAAADQSHEVNEQPAAANDVEEVQESVPSTDSAAEAELISYNLRSRQIRGKTLLTYDPSNAHRR